MQKEEASSKNWTQQVSLKLPREDKLVMGSSYGHYCLDWENSTCSSEGSTEL